MHILHRFSTGDGGDISTCEEILNSSRLGLLYIEYTTPCEATSVFEAATLPHTVIFSGSIQFELLLMVGLYQCFAIFLKSAPSNDVPLLPFVQLNSKKFALQAFSSICYSKDLDLDPGDTMQYYAGCCTSFGCR
jgi:hypothetical protein